MLRRRLPSVKTLREVFRENAPEARRILEMSRDELATLPAGEARIRECYKPPKTWDVRLHCLNALAGTYGVEGFQTRAGEYVEYLNTGDTYAPTVIYWRGRYTVGSWGDIAEKHA